MAEGEITLEHHRGPHPEHQQLGELLKHLAGFIEEGAGDRFLERSGDVFGVEVLPFPTAHHLHVLGLHRLDAGEHFHQVALGAGVLLGRLAVLAAEQGGPQQGEGDLDRQHRQGNDREHPAVEGHHDDVDHREGRIQQGHQGLAREEVADLLQLGDAAPQFPHRAAIEIAQG